MKFMALNQKKMSDKIIKHRLKEKVAKVLYTKEATESEQEYFDRIKKEIKDNKPKTKRIEK